MSTRRSFLKQSALLIGGFAATQSFAGGFHLGKKTSVIIIGAGFAGLAAAKMLRRKNIPYVILEARNRVGGRVFSFEADPAEKLVIELGAEWVGKSHERLISLCDEYKLELQNNQFDTHLVYKGQYHAKDDWGFSEPWKKKWETLLKEYPHLTLADKKALDKYDWWRYLVNNGCQGMDLDIRELLDSTDFGESIRHVSAFAALSEYAESSEKNEMDYKIKGGNGMLAQRIADEIGRENIHLEHKVKTIRQGAKVEVICDNGKTFTADKLICTTPTFAAMKIDWQPRLPIDTLNAMKQLQYARINKHPVLFSERFWKDESFDMITDLPAHYFYHATKNQSSKKGVLISYTIGDKAAVIANQGDDWNGRTVLEALQPGFGDVKPLMEKQFNYYWGQDEFSMGAYALYGAGQWYGLRPALQRPFLHTHFAGEHLADWQGFMEGAINTGENAANAVNG
ncbi:NAD(P)/FAD-dependent oxidoreductase [Ferruginibacter sp. HRS2-29]|uniref:flavin monoamine oxidase family protein n=1 Tax=Ferruginibacter sp. HRS2-29 TaxID=2487334 RepID=UPI0020CD24E0|nr:NAD(P)/FAD-dependent oxidoreductase [Ferruginibacter sp. HRS2-29]MCP9750717.1 FAD-dependent oxidoreductase [Ferruginibacter sp. HRS2-29]